MTLLETVRGRPAAKLAPRGAILAELKIAEAEVARLEAQHGAAALDAFANETGAEKRLEDLNRQLATGRERANTLKAAHKAAAEREEAAILAQRAALQKTQRAACLKHLQARDAAADALSIAIADAAEHYHALLDLSAKAQAACPVLTQWPDGSLCDEGSIRRLVGGEMCRVSVTAGNRDGRALPGSALPGTEFEWQPNAIAPMAEQVKAASAFLASRLKGEAV
jgi:hypothetical protein